MPPPAYWYCQLLLGEVSATQVAAEFRYDTSNGSFILNYGQLDPAYLSFDDGVSTIKEVVDNSNSKSRVGFWYRKPANTGEFSVNLETSFGLRLSDGLSQTNTPDAIDWQRTNTRKIGAIWKDDCYSSFFLGQGSMSSNGASSQDLSGTTLVLYNSLGDTAGAFLFRRTAGAFSTKTIGQAFGSYAGSRKARVRYDTASIGGVLQPSA